MLYIPQDWNHATINVQESIGVAMNYAVRASQALITQCALALSFRSKNLMRDGPSSVPNRSPRPEDNRAPCASCAQAGALDKTVLKALDFHFGTERPEQIAELTAEGYKALQEAERSELPRYRCHLGCILLKMASVSLRTESCGKRKGGVACAEAVLALAICEVHAYVFNGLDVHGVPRSDCQLQHDHFRGLACACWRFQAQG